MSDENSNSPWNAVGGIVSSVGDLFGIGRGRRQNKQARKNMLFQHQLDMQAFDYANRYNTPAKQMERLKSAGLNPALMYGQGTTGNAGTPPVTKPLPAFTETPVDTSKAVQGMLNMGHLNYVNKQANHEKIKTQLSIIDRSVQEKYQGPMQKALLDNALKDLQVKDSEIDKNYSGIELNNSVISLNETNKNLNNSKIELNGFQKLQVQEMTTQIVQNTELIKAQTSKINKELELVQKRGWSDNTWVNIATMLGAEENTPADMKWVVAGSLAQFFPFGKAGKLASKLTPQTLKILSKLNKAVRYRLGLKGWLKP